MRHWVSYVTLDRGISLLFFSKLEAPLENVPRSETTRIVNVDALLKAGVKIENGVGLSRKFGSFTDSYSFLLFSKIGTL